MEYTKCASITRYGRVARANLREVMNASVHFERGAPVNPVLPLTPAYLDITYRDLTHV
jgi:hypothetical protein